MKLAGNWKKLVRIDDRAPTQEGGGGGDREEIEDRQANNINLLILLKISANLHSKLNYISI